MFWNSILEGFKILTHYEIYIAVIFYSVAHFFILKLTDTTNKYTGQFQFSLIKFILEQILSTLSISILIYIVAPILVGQNSISSFGEFTSFLFKMPKLILVNTVIFIALAFIPVIGNFVMTNNGMATLIGGFIAFFGYLGIKENVENLNINIDYSVVKSGLIKSIPSFWFVILYLCIAGGLSFIADKATIFIYNTSDIQKRIERGELIELNKNLLTLKTIAEIFITTMAGLIVLSMAVYYLIQNLKGL